MIMNMNEKGRQTKLLAAIAIIAMVVCALAVVLPSENVEAAEPPTEVSTAEGLNAAIADSSVTEIKLTTNVTADSVSRITNKSIDLNGFTLTTNNQIRVNNSTITNGTVSSSYSASSILMLEGASPTISKLNLTRTVDAPRSVISVAHGTSATITECDIVDTSNDPVAVYFNGSSGTCKITNCDFGSNTGGARCVNVGDVTKLTITNSSEIDLNVMGSDNTISVGTSDSNGIVLSNTSIAILQVDRADVTIDDEITVESVWNYGTLNIDGTLNATDFNNSGTLNVAGTVTSGTLKIEGSNELTITGTGTVTAGDLVLNGDLAINSGITMTAGEITGSGTITVNSGAVFEYASKSADVKFAGEGTIKITGAQGTENIISVSQNVNGTYYLTADTTILSGVTLTVPRNAVLDLMGYDLTVEGTLVVENRGTVTSSKNTESNIVLTTTGAIQNEGTIGDKMLINIANGEMYDEATDSYGEYVSMQGVTGVSIQLVRTIEGTDRVYNMAVSGDVSAVRGVDAPMLTLTDVNINGNMTVGRDITFNIAGTTNVTGNGTVFTFDGKLMTITGDGFTLTNGTTAVINGYATGTINTETGTVSDENGELEDSETPAFVKLNGTGVTVGTSTTDSYVVGLTVSVSRVTVPQDEGDAVVEQRMFVNGDLSAANDERSPESRLALINFGGKVFVTESLTLTDEVSVSAVLGGSYTFMVSEGGVVTAVGNGGLSYNGAMYEVDGETTSDPSTYYYTTFAGAMENIATAVETTIYVDGSFTITGTYAVGADQAIDVPLGTSTEMDITVGDGASITVDADGFISDYAFNEILGKVTALEGDGYSPAEDKDIFAVKAVDEETLDTTYSGLKTAMDEAQAGQTIQVVGSTTYDGDLVIPNGVTVQVNETKTLTVTGDVTIENGGKLVLDASKLVVGEDKSENTVTVAGELDASEAGVIEAYKDVAKNEAAASVDIYSTGKLTSTTKIVADSVMTINSAYYQDGEYVYTSLANAVAYAEENALPYAVHVTGIFTETGAVESDGVDIEVDNGAEVTLGDLRLNDARIYSADATVPAVQGTYTATITALNGAGDAAVDATVAVTKTTATVESKVTLNAEGTSQYALQIDNLANANVQAGTVTYVGGNFTVDKNKSLTIASGATLLIGASVTMTNGADAMVNNGTIQVAKKKTLTVEGTLAGNVNVPKDATLKSVTGGMTITGTVTVDAQGSFQADGKLQMGAAPELLTDTAAGAVVGKLTLADIVAFAGADLSQADIVLNGDVAAELKNTAYQINGIDFVTVYTFGSVDISSINDAVKDMKDLQTKVIQSGVETDVDIEIVWYADGVAVSSSDASKNLDADVGEYTQVSSEIRYRTVDIKVSEGPAITVSIDGVVWNGVNPVKLTIGTHTVSAVVDPGYTGTIQITFNGVAVTNGQFEITSDMMDSIEDIVLSASGNITQDSTVVVDGGNQGGSGEMGLTDYLLIILVILIVVMAIMVAMRLMRS